MSFKTLISIGAVGLLFACSSGDNALPAAPTGLRPGTLDSSRAFQGTPSKAENEFWVAVRAGDDGARQLAVANLKTDVMKDPTNGYSAYLAAASAFIPSADLVRALSAGQVIPPTPPGALPADTGPLLEQALAHLKDPLYVGFSATLLFAVQIGVDPAKAANTLQIALSNNVPASSIGNVIGALSMRNVNGAIDVLTNMFSYCSGAPFDHDNADLNAFVDEANAAGFVHRECYSGYHATHATEGELLLMGDLLAVAGKPEVAMRYYQATRRATNYASWPLQSLAERRIQGSQAAAEGDLVPVASCTTCHINQLP